MNLQEFKSEINEPPKDCRRDYVIHGMVGAAERVMSIIESVRLKPRTTLNYEKTHKLSEHFGLFYKHFVYLVDELNFNLKSVESRAEEIHDIQSADRHFDEGFEHFRKVMTQVAQISRLRLNELDGDDSVLEKEVDISMCADIHGRLCESAHHFGLFDIQLVLERYEQ